MFNVYYINYAKAFEIAMQMDNKILEQTIKDHGWSADGNGQMDIDTGIKNPLISKLLPKLDASLSLNVSKSSRASDTIPMPAVIHVLREYGRRYGLRMCQTTI